MKEDNLAQNDMRKEASVGKNDHTKVAGESAEKGDTEGTEFVQPDGGWGWVVCLTSLCANGVVFGSLNTFGILYVAMRERYGGEDSQNSFVISLVGSVCSGLTFLLSMVASILSDRFGIRKVAFIGSATAFLGMLSSAFVDNVFIYFLTYSVMIGTGFSLIYAPSLVILGHYFTRKMGIANGLVTFGSAAFTITYALVIPPLLERTGLRYTMVCLSGFIFLVMPCSLTWKPLVKWKPRSCPSATSKEEQEEGNSGCGGCCGGGCCGGGCGGCGCGGGCCYRRVSRYMNLSIWRKRGYVVWVLARAVAFFGYFVPFTHLVQHTKDQFPGSDGNLLPMVMSIASGVARILFGFLVDFQNVSIIRMEQVGLVSLGVCTICLPFADSFTSLIIICLVMGLCDGVLICLVGLMAFDLVGKDGASQAIGFLFGLVAIPMTLGPPLAGLCYDYLGSYTVAFHAAGAPSLLGAALVFLIPKHQELSSQLTDLAGVSQSITVTEEKKEKEEKNPDRNGAAAKEDSNIFTITKTSPTTTIIHRDLEEYGMNDIRKDAPRCSKRIDGMLMNNTMSECL